MARIGVDCRFSVEGTVDVRRIYLKGSWQVVEQGRQWVDRSGRHVLIMLPGRYVQRITLRPDTLTWELISEADRGMTAA